MKKQIKILALFVLTLSILFSLSACLDPIGMIPDLTLRVGGDINYTDVTAGAFVINNLSKTIEVDLISVAHSSYNGRNRTFINEPIPESSKAIFVNASEENYLFEVHWSHPTATGDNPLKRSFTMPQSRGVREYYLFMTEDGEIKLEEGTIAEMVLNFNYNQGDTNINLVQDPAINLIASYLFDAYNSGWLTIANDSERQLQGITIQPAPKDTVLMSSLTQAESSYINSWSANLISRNVGVKELPTTGVRVRAGDYMVLYNGNLIHEVSVQPQAGTNYGGTNVVTINNLLFENGGTPPTTPRLNEIRATMFGMSSPFFWSASSNNVAPNWNRWNNINVNSVISPGVILVGPGTISERQKVVNDSREFRPFDPANPQNGANYFSHGPGVELTSNGITEFSVRKISNTNAWVQYRIFADKNNGLELVLRINY